MLWRRGVSTGPRFVAIADPHFRRSDQLRLELPATATSDATARLLDRSGAPMSIPLQISHRPDNDMTWVVVQVPLTPLAPADYVVEVSQDEATVLTPFRIVP